jgi:transcription initiation factor TFIIIB Brf1 subunit/transcription initiation factor TFIIB
MFTFFILLMSSSTCCLKQSIILEKEGYVCENCGVCVPGVYIAEQKPFKNLSYSPHPNSRVIHSNNIGTRIDGPLTKLSIYSRNMSINSKEYTFELLCREVKNRLEEHTANGIIERCLRNFHSINYKNSRTTRNSFKGRIKNGLIAVCLFFAFKESGVERNFLHICRWMGIDKKTFAKCFKMYINLIRDRDSKNDFEDFDSINISAVIESQCGQFDLEYKYIRLCIKIYDAVTALKILKNKTPYTKVNCVIYYIITHPELNLEEVDKSLVSHIFTTSETTLQKVSKLLRQKEVYLFNFINKNIIL